MSDPSFGAEAASAVPHEPAAPDLTACDREPIHLPGAIQGHGLLLTVAGADRRIERASTSAGAWTGIDAEGLLGRTIDEALPALAGVLPDEEAIPDRIRGVRTVSLDLGADGGPRHASLLCHRVGDETVIELEPVGDEAALAPLLDRLGDGLAEIAAAEDEASVADSLCRAIRAVNGFDRVCLERFEENWDGTVIAEARARTADGFLGLRFPASDIPAQARRLYEVEPVRAIPDAAAPTSVIVAAAGRRGALDCSHAALRAVSPVHLEYLANMGVRASMSASLLRPDGHLRGLVACHHPEPRAVDHRVRAACRVLAETAAVRLAALDRAEARRAEVRVEVLERDLALAVAEAGALEAALLERSDILLELFGATGGALVDADAVRPFGRAPEASIVRRIARAARDRPVVWSTRRARVELPEVDASPAEACGVLSIRLDDARRDADARRLLLFRPEARSEILWAGDPLEKVRLDDEVVRISPRRSFAAWRQQVAGLADPWPKTAERTAEMLRRAAAGVIAEASRRRTARLEAEVAARTRELRARVEAMRDFTFIASHELQSPLHAIEGLADLSRRHHDEGRTERVTEDLAMLVRTIATVRRTLDGLLAVCTVGQEGLHRERLDLRTVVESAIDAVQDDAVRRGIAFRCGELPEVVADRTLLRQVLVNLCSNAVKHGRDGGQVVVAARREEAEPAGWTIEIADDGRGFEGPAAERIFLPFQRLVPTVPGSGLGLSIVRRIVELHGGRAWATSTGPGQGATFRFSLPDAPVDDPAAADGSSTGAAQRDQRTSSR